MRWFSVTLLLGLLTISADAQTANSKSPRPKPAPTPAKKLSEQAEWDKANAQTDASRRIAAFKRFINNFPGSTHLDEATTLLVTTEYGLANDKLVAGEIDEAADLYTAAVGDAPKPVPDQMWGEQLSKIAPNLYFRGARGEALDIAKLLEAKADASGAQLLDVAAFYLSIENGTEAKRVADAVIKLDPNSAVAYQTLGLAHRMEFDLDDSAAAFAKALELQPDSAAARRGLAEMKRALGKSDEAVTLYREILEKDETNVPARTGLILSLFDAGNRTDAEAEMAKSLEANPGNVILLAGAAYWYAAHNDGVKAVEYSQKAIDSDPRFIWSHIALARGQVVQGKPVDAEKTLLAARRYGNFPTVDYELASVRLAAGLYREAAEELAKSFVVKDGTIHTKLGGRVPRESKSFSELVGVERRASIFAPTAADDPERAAQLRALLELKQALDATEPNADAAATAADEFARGDDRMKIHRQLFAASQLLEKKVALPKVLEIVKTAPQALDHGLDVPDVSTAVLASELYESRKIAAARDDYVSVPIVPRTTLSAVMRGRIEEITGWTYYQMQDSEQATVHLRRAISVLPADSSYWRSSLWRLGTVLTVAGKDTEALDAYVKSYKGSTPDPVRYTAIASLYKRINGTTEGLDALIGTNPSELVAQNSAQDPTSVLPGPSPLAEASPLPSPSPVAFAAPRTPSVVPIATPAVPDPTPSPAIEEPSPVPTVEVPTPTPTLGVATPTPTAEHPIPSPTPTAELPTPSPVPTSAASPPSELTNAALGLPEATPMAPERTQEAPMPSPTATAVTGETPAPTTETISELEPSPTPTPTAKGAVAQNSKELFPPVIITIPAAANPKTAKSPAAVPSPSPEAAEPAPSPTATPEIAPCRLTVSEESITLWVGGGDVAVIVGRTDDNDLDGLTAASTSPENVGIRRQEIEGMRQRALFVLHPAGTSPGIFQVIFEMPCGRREIVVRLK